METTGRINVLVVDDSSLAREFIIALLSTDKRINVIGEAANGLEAVERVYELKPDIVLMDIEMPIMGGLEAIEEIMANNPLPILVVTSRGDAGLAYSAISKGALEVLPKSDLDPDIPWKFIDNVILLSKVKVITHLRSKSISSVLRPEKETPAFRHIAAIAASTGGPKILSNILPELPEDIKVPIVIAQHIADGFLEGLVKWLDSISKVGVKIADDNEILRAGTVYFSPPERHMVVNYGSRVSLLDRKATDIYHPSCDMLLSSVASIFGKRSIGIILTGMGKDGVAGMGRIRESGGITIAQDEATSIVFGMPKHAISSGFVDKVLPSERIVGELLRIIYN